MYILIQHNCRLCCYSLSFIFHFWYLPYSINEVYKTEPQVIQIIIYNTKNKGKVRICQSAKNRVKSVTTPIVWARHVHKMYGHVLQLDQAFLILCHWKWLVHCNMTIMYQKNLIWCNVMSFDCLNCYILSVTSTVFNVRLVILTIFQDVNKLCVLIKSRKHGHFHRLYHLHPVQISTKPNP